MESSDPAKPDKEADKPILMSDPYESPTSQPDPAPPTAKSGCRAPVVGCLSGGCVIPIALFLLAAFSGDVGGPLIWPMLSVFLGVVGMVVEIGYRLVKKMVSS